MDTHNATQSPPNVNLPPAALRLESLDFDPTGNPYYKFPPFLSPPGGVALITFEKFTPHGIQITLDPDQEELDGEGVPTVELGARHNTVISERDRKKKKKKKKDSDQPKKFSPWWDDWAEGEDLRRATVFDLNSPRSERFGAGALEFARGRKFLPTLQSLYDHFRHFSGLLTAPKRDKYGRGGDEEEVDDEAEDDEAEFNAERAATEQEAESNSHPETVNDVDKEDYEARLAEVDEETDFRLDAFLNDPETSMRIFFSSFYKDKGLAWNEPKLRDGPILLSFFLAFFVRNRIMPDYQKAFLKAHKVTELARLELPQTAKISMALPDYFGRACVALWGGQMHTQWTATDMNDDATGAPAAAPDLDPAPVSDPAPMTEFAEEFEKELHERGLEKIEIDDVPSGWSEKYSEEPMVGGWGDNARVLSDDSVNPWDPLANRQDWNTGEPEPSLLELFGPTTLPLTHSVRRAEKATRQIVAFAPPRADATGLERILGTVVLAPWKKYYKGTPILRPQMLVDSGVDVFDSSRDLIRAFVCPEVIDTLREGMGLHGVFVQVVQNEGTGAPKEQIPKPRGKTRGKAKSADDKEWWYFEFLYEVIPSFWTEESELE